MARVFLAGATGVIGRPLVPALRAAGHEVVALTRSPEKAEALRAAGAEPVVADALDSAALRGAVESAQPEVVINQLTDLPPAFNPRKIDYGMTNRLRGEAGATLAAAAASAGARRLITQGLAFVYEPAGDWVKDEEAPVMADPPPPFGEALASMMELERVTLETPGVEGVVLRYGFFYGPGSWYAADGTSTADVRKRRLPIVGDGAAMTSWIHAEDAASATVAAIDRGSPGIYNVVDDEPAPMRDWIPYFAETIGAKPPRKVPKFVARIVAGRFGAEMGSTLRGASNAKAKRELGWQPGYPSWRQGFREALG